MHQHEQEELEKYLDFIKQLEEDLRCARDARERRGFENDIKELKQRIHNRETELGLNPIHNVKPKDQLIVEGCKLLESKKLDEAEKKFNEAQRCNNNSPEPWYWKAQVALADNNQPVALKYIEKALKLDSNNLDCRVLQIKILLLSGGKHRQQAKEIAEEVANISSDLKAWVDDLKNENVFSSLVITSRELEMKFPISIFKN